MTPSPSQTWQPTDKASCHVVRSPAPLPILDLDFKEKMVLEGIIWQELNVLFGTVIFQSAGLDRRGVGSAQRCYVASGSEPWLRMQGFQAPAVIGPIPASQNQTLGVLHFCFPLI